MRAIVEALAEQHAELDGLLALLDGEDWARPTRCVGWTVADVVLHVSQTDELALASAEGRFTAGLEVLAGGLTPHGTVDDGASAMVERERGQPPAAVRERWQDGAAALRAVLAKGDAHQRVRWVAGQLSLRTLATTRLAECWIHTGDVADAVGVQLVPMDRLEHVARLAWRTLPYAFARDGRSLTGPIAFDLLAPGGERWRFLPDGDAVTVIEGSGAELCNVAARRVDPADTALRGTGPDAEAVLSLVRTYA